ncbi:MAG: hypothetical protein WC269_04890 [Candidatus Gracilibacteria bacterium]|jgi:hypothetical protein
MNCKVCQKPIERTAQEKALYKKFGFEDQELCFECDHRQRTCFRNERALYSRKCDKTGEHIISVYSPDKPYKVYRSDIWYGDSWDALDYGRDFDFSRSFFEQFAELQREVPRVALANVNGENSDYCNMTVYNKNCYLVFGGDYNQDVQYGTLCMNSKDCLDLDISNDNEQSYFLGDSVKCYGSQYVFDSNNCNNCYYLSDCTGCTECILCTNLVKRSYYILNKQYSKEEYFEKKKELITGSYKQRQKNWNEFLNLLKKRIVKFSHQISCENCTGDYLKNSKNCHNSFDVSESEDLYNTVVTYNAKDCFNCSLIGHGAELCYNIQSVIDAVDSMCSYFIFESSGIAYGDLLISCHDCFGCVGLQHKRNCILNKQYSKDEYKVLRAKIVEHMKKTGEWGQFFPHNISCFGFNESTAAEYFPLSKEEAIKQGYNWSDAEEKKPQASKTVTADQIPDSINDVTDEILDWAIECEKSKRLFKITLHELKFYRTHNLPIPHLHSDERHMIRLNLRTPRKLWTRKCASCGADINTTYSPDRSEVVYCEKCYLSKIY